MEGAGRPEGGAEREVQKTQSHDWWTFGEVQRQAREKEESQKNRKSGTATGTTYVVPEVIVVGVFD